MSMEVTRRLAEFIVSTGFEDLPPEVITEAKLCFFDWLAVTLAGANDPDVNSLIEVVDLVGGNEQATVLGRNIKTSVLNAALLNGMFSHVLDFDDTSVEFLGHASVTLFPCLLALSEWKEKSGRELISAYVVGFELGCRVAMGATVNHYLAGWHGTSTIGHFSSTSGCARLLDLTSEQVVHALGAAGTQAAGIKAVFGTSCKPFHAGKAAFNGLLSVLLAERGFTSVDNILEGEKCFWDIFSKDWQAESALGELGKKWNILNNNYKFHASCYGTHAPIEAVLALKKEHGIELGDIDKIDINVNPAILEIAGKMKPTKALEGKFSIAYSVANALLRGDTGLAAFTDEKVNDPDAVKLRDKVNLIPDTEVEAFESDITIHAGAKKHQKRFNILQHKIDADEKRELIVQKFRSLAGFTLESGRIGELVERIENLEQESNIADLVKLMV
jgi:2-methylcitrate dehydratase PrpD